jgi:hypothetical protein
MNHKSIPSLSSSISTVENTSTSSTPRTSSSYTNNTTLTHSSSLRSNYAQQLQPPQHHKRYSEPSPIITKRWDDSQLEMELAEDDLIDDKKKKVRRNSSLRLKQKFQLSAESYNIIDKFRHHRRTSQSDQIVIIKQNNKLSNPFKKVCDWLF